MAHHEGRVVFVRYALPGERVRVRVTADRGSYWHAEVVEVLEPSADRIESLCPIAGVDGAGCCDLAFADPDAARRSRRDVVANQLARLGGYQLAAASAGAAVGCPGRPVGAPGCGWTSAPDRRPGFHRYHSDELVTDLRCAQLPTACWTGWMSVGVAARVRSCTWPSTTTAQRHVVRTAAHGQADVDQGGARATTRRCSGSGERSWRVPVTAFWQAHRDAARVYSELVADWAQPGAGMTAWDLYGGAGVFAAVLGEAVGESGRVVTVDTSRGVVAGGAGRAGRSPQVRRRHRFGAPGAGGAASASADVAVLDPPRSGAGREVIDLLAAAEVPRIVHIGCEAASFARDVGLYRGHGYAVEELRVFDAFPLTHHVECVALLTALAKCVAAADAGRKRAKSEATIVNETAHYALIVLFCQCRRFGRSPGEPAHRASENPSGPARAGRSCRGGAYPARGAATVRADRGAGHHHRAGAGVVRRRNAHRAGALPRGGCPILSVGVVGTALTAAGAALMLHYAMRNQLVSRGARGHSGSSH